MLSLKWLCIASSITHLYGTIQCEKYQKTKRIVRVRLSAQVFLLSIASGLAVRNSTQYQWLQPISTLYGRPEVYFIHSLFNDIASNINGPIQCWKIRWLMKNKAERMQKVAVMALFKVLFRNILGQYLENHKHTWVRISGPWNKILNPEHSE